MLDNLMTRRLLHLCAFLLLTATAASADPGRPVAVRFWGQGLVTIETYWNLRIAVDPYALQIGYDDPKIKADLVLVTHEHFDHNNVSLVGGAPIVERGLDADGRFRPLDVVLDRPPNEPAPRLRPTTADPYPARTVRIRSIESYHDDVAGEQRGRNAMFLIEVNGTRILHCGDLGQARLTPRQLQAIGPIDVLLIPVGGVYTINGRDAAEITAQLGPRMVVPIHYKTALLTIELQTADSFLAALGPDYRQVLPVGNTLAVSAADGATAEPAVVLLKTRPWQMGPELAALYETKEQAAAAAQEVFAPLSVGQMNHRPGDGTHTPRWNAEHMMGRELGYFTTIFSTVDPQVAVIDLNPQQMPPDYKAAHPDWTGAEEARQIERVQRLSRRFAYLLDGMDLDATPADGTWTLRALLEQMQRHYQQHTANVKKKFQLPDWPQR